ncbi:MAG: SdpI family protein, partial [Bacteroidota bacterium]|nr:SdpI family protein [Bacteroidota bacterium]
MKTKYNSADLTAFAVMLIPTIYLAFNYSAMPKDIPIHFNLHGADGYGVKSTSWLFIIIMMFGSFSVYSYLKNIPSIDPKRTAESSTSMIKKISFLVVIFISAFQVIAINAMKGNVFSILTFLLPAVSIFFSLIGNLMNNLQPNYFIGIRVPWALQDETNWRETHRFGG